MNHMNVETIKLGGENTKATLTTFVPCSRTEKRDAILVIPGGGYSMVCSDREGESIAIAFNALGYACFVLDYSVMEEAVFPRPLIEASLAMVHIRENAEKYGINPDRVFVLGFSAGGSEEYRKATDFIFDKIAELEGRPNIAMMKQPELLYEREIRRWLNSLHSDTLFQSAIKTELQIF